jgi:hypothetical protein
MRVLRRLAGLDMPQFNLMTRTHKYASSTSAAKLTDRSMEAAEYLSLDEKTITRWARKGYIPAHPLGEGTAASGGF